jgi:hypothetical protein
MRNFSTNVLQLLGSDNISGYFLVEIKNDKVLLRHTNLPHDIVIPSIGTFSANNGLVAIEPPKLSSVVDREAYKITYTDPEFTMRPIFEQGVLGADITVYVGFINTTEGDLGGALPSQPMTAAEDLVIAYKGVLDSHGYNITDEEITVAIEGSSPMADLSLVRTLVTSKDFSKQIDPDDTAFEQVYTGSRVVNLLWGRG